MGREVASCPLHQGFFKATGGHSVVSHLSHQLALAVSQRQLVEIQ